MDCFKTNAVLLGIRGSFVKGLRIKHLVLYLMVTVLTITLLVYVARITTGLVAFLLITGMALVLITTTLYYIFLRPLYKVHEYIQKIYQNDLTFKVDVVQSGLYKGIMADIENTVNNLKNNFRQEVKISTEIAEISSQLNTVTSESTETMAAIAASTEITSRHGEEQFEMLNEIAQENVAMMETLNRVSEEMNNTTSFTAETIKEAQRGINATSVIKGKMEEIKDVVEATAQQVDKLDEDSKKMGSMMELIGSITEQTNLLSLNASIEAARAGEHGRGFMVVAQEVSKLSQDTKKVSTEIEEMLIGLQKEITLISDWMKKERLQVIESYRLINETVEDFYKVNNALQTSVDKVENMNRSIIKVNSQGQSIAKNIEDITSFSKEISAQMQQSTAEVILQNQRLVNLQSITNKLYENADEMQQYVTSRVMEGKMLKEVSFIKEGIKNESFNKQDINLLLEKTAMDAIYITDENGVVKYCNDKDAIGLDLYKVDESYKALREGNITFIATPIKKRVEDNRLFKFLAIIDEKGIIYQVGLSIESLLKF